MYSKIYDKTSLIVSHYYSYGGSKKYLFSCLEIKTIDRESCRYFVHTYTNGSLQYTLNMVTMVSKTTVA